MDKTYKAEEKIEEKNEKADKFNAAPYSTGKVAASFTSTAMNRETVHEAAIIEEDIVRYSRVKKKGKFQNVKNMMLHTIAKGKGRWFKAANEYREELDNFS